MKIERIKETCLYVSDLHKTIEFYTRVLELPLYSHVEGRHAFFRAGESMLLCFNPEITLHDTSLPPHGCSGIIHLAFEVSSEDYTRIKGDLISKEIIITKEMLWTNGKKSFYFNDPDGHVLEIAENTIWESKWHPAKDAFL